LGKQAYPEPSLKEMDGFTPSRGTKYLKQKQLKWVNQFPGSGFMP
jgi:hypothetical protein